MILPKAGARLAVFGISLNHGGVQIQEAAKKFADALAARSGLPVELRVERDYEQLFDSIQSGKTTLAWLPPLF